MKKNILGILSLIFGIISIPLLSLLFGIPAIILGSMGLQRKQKYSLAGLICGIVGCSLWLIGFIALLFFVDLAFII